MNPGDLNKVQNKAKGDNHTFGEAGEYYLTHLKLNGQYEPFIFTENQIAVARERAAKNPEDVIPLSQPAKAEPIKITVVSRIQNWFKNLW